MAIQDLTASLDLKQNLNIYAACKQFDNINLILIVYDNSIQANLVDYNVRLVAMKSDKIPLIQEQMGITISNNIVTIAASEQLTTTSGNTLVELQFIHKTTGQKKATFNLVLMVNPSALQIDSTISTATYTLLQELENKLDQATNYFEDVVAFQQAHSNLLDLDNRVTQNTTSLSDKANDTDATRTTSSKTVTGAINELNNNKLNKTQIVNNLTATVSGSVLDATQGRILNEGLKNIVYRTIVVNPNGQSYVDIPLNVTAGSFSIAINGDNNAASDMYITGTSCSAGYIHISLNKARTGDMRINILYTQNSVW